MEISPCEKAIAKHLEEVFGNRPKIFIHRETKDDPFFIAVASMADYPSPGMVTMSTIGTSSYPLFQDDGAEYPDTRVEFIASAQTGQDADMEQALFRAAVFVGKVKGFARPGIFLHNLIGQFRNSGHVPHAFLTTPFAYDGLEDKKVFSGQRVSWLQVLPVSEREISYAQENSTDVLEDLFEREDIEWENIDRLSAV
ncbi:suppressor of fused domain protein (plasmid) [Agrobacterium sp. rho-8.1]|nr:suppressor of fused domain protein [Agrobacterium sp. rho-8.1]